MKNLQLQETFGLFYLKMYRVKSDHYISNMQEMLAKSANTCTVIWEMFVVKIFSWFKSTTKIKRTKFLLQCIFNTTKIYCVARLACVQPHTLKIGMSITSYLKPRSGLPDPKGPCTIYQPAAISCDCKAAISCDYKAAKTDKKREYRPSFSSLQRTDHDHCVVPARITILHHPRPPCPAFSILCTRLRRNFVHLILNVN